MATLEEPSFNTLLARRISFVSASSWDDERCKKFHVVQLQSLK